MKQAALSRFFAKAPKGDAAKDQRAANKAVPGPYDIKKPVANAKRPSLATDRPAPETKRLRRASDSADVASVDHTSSPSGDAIILSQEQQEELPSQASGPTKAGGERLPTGDRDPPAVPPRDDLRHQQLQRKLVDNGRAGGESSSKDSTGTRKYATDPQPGAKLTPLEQQVVDLKRKHPGVLLLVEVGYKMCFYGTDAESASQVCNIMAFPSGNFLCASIPVPRLHIHVRRLVKAGYKVGVVRQTESAALKAVGDNKRGPFVRELAALYTPATLDAGEVETGGLDSADAAAASADKDSLGGSSFLMAIIEQPLGAPAADVAVVAVDCSCGDVRTSTFREGSTRSSLEAALMQVAPAELLLVEPLSQHTEKLVASWAGSSSGGGGVRVERVRRERYASGGAHASVASFFAESEGTGSSSAAEQVLRLPDLVVEAVAHVIDYLRAFSMERVFGQGVCFQPLGAQGEMTLTPNCLTHLEVLANSDDGGIKGSLLWLLGNTLTRGGARLVRHWLTRPLTDLQAILRRQEAVKVLIQACGGGADSIATRLPKLLGAIPDLEVGVTRMLHKTASPSEGYRVLAAIGGLARQLGLASREDRMVAGCEHLSPLKAESELLHGLLSTATDPLVEAAASELLGGLNESAAKEDDIIGLLNDKERFPEVFACHEEVEAADGAMAGILKDIRKELRRPSLGYTKIQNQGEYLIELPADSKAPHGWAKVCSTKKVDRYHPPAVKDGIARREQALERRKLTCKAAWSAFLDDVATHYCSFRAAALALSQADALLCLAQVSSGAGFCKPDFVSASDAPQISISAGRHPMLDALHPTHCVANDTQLSGGEGGQSAMLVTGPNMGGKSCFIRQSALIVIMAQIGCYVPAEKCRLHVVDNIFTRMGASDNLAAGRSTFQVELTEASYILSNATPRSLVIIDELGRGTSTHDGVAIAWGTLEHLLKSQRCLTLFVTHYPQLAQLCPKFAALGAYFMAYTEDRPKLAPDGGTSPSSPEPAATSAPRITFLYKVTPGVVESSFGMNVAALAGLPASVIGRATERAATLEREVGLRTTSGGSCPEPGHDGASVAGAVRSVMISAAGSSARGEPSLTELQHSAVELLRSTGSQR